MTTRPPAPAGSSDVEVAYHEAMCKTNELGYAGMTVEQVLQAQDDDIVTLRKQVDSLMRTQKGDPYVPTLRDARRLQEAIEGECDGLSPEVHTCCRILFYVATGELPAGAPQFEEGQR